MAKGRASNFLVWVLLGLLIVGLAGFGATNFGGSVRSIGTVGDTEIDVNRYARALQQELRALQAQTGRSFSLSEAQSFGVDQIVLQRLITSASLEDEVARIGLSVGDQEVRRQIVDVPAFQGSDGQFDREAYQFTLSQSGVSVSEFEDQMRVETASQLLQGAVAAGVATPGILTDTIYAYAREERDITWAPLTEAALDAPVPEPTEEDLRAFHEANAEAFTQAETRAVTYVWLTPDMIVDSVEIDEDTLRAAYDERIDEFVQPERRLAERLVYATEAEAEAARARIDAGEATFDDLVAERNLTLDDVDIGDVARADLDDAADIVFALTEPGIAGPVETLLGSALFRINAILSARETTFDQARPDLLGELAADRARRIIDDSITDIDDLLAGGATLEELAGETDMQLGQIDWRSDVTDDIAAYTEFRDVAAQTTPDDFPQVAPLADGGIFALRVDEIRPPALLPLDTVRGDVIAAWRADQTTQMLSALAEDIASDLRDGREMAGIGLALSTDRDLRRDGFVEGTPPGFLEAVFEMDPDAVRVIAEAGLVLIVRLDAVRLPGGDDAEEQALKQAFATQAAQGFAQDLLQSFIEARLADTGIDLNQTAINAVHAQFP